MPRQLATNAELTKMINDRLREGKELDGNNPQSGHAYRMSCLQCDLSEILEQTKPPDPELVDLIEKAFIQGQIDSRTADLTYLWLLGCQKFYR